MTRTPARAGTIRVAVVLVLAAVIVCLPPDGRASSGAPGPVLPEVMDRETVEAINQALNYLAKTQRMDGSWLNQGGYGMYPAVMTSLSGLAFMAGGSTPENGPYFRNVNRAMNYVLRVGEAHAADGLICGPGSESRSMYGHGFSMLFLAQCYGMGVSGETEKRIRKVLERAVALTVKSQSKDGGWIYRPTGQGDEGSVTVTQLQALRACRNAGINVPPRTIERAVGYLQFCQNPDGGICYSAKNRGRSRPAISAAAIACFYAAGIYDRATGGEGPEAEMVGKLTKYVRKNVAVDKNNHYYFYMHLYMAQVMYQRGGKEWKDYYSKISRKLLGLQSPDWSWNGDNVGTVYGTAIATIILQLPYGYLPICQK